MSQGNTDYVHRIYFAHLHRVTSVFFIVSSIGGSTVVVYRQAILLILILYLSAQIAR